MKNIIFDHPMARVLAIAVIFAVNGLAEKTIVGLSASFVALIAVSSHNGNLIKRFGKALFTPLLPFAIVAIVFGVLSFEGVQGKQLVALGLTYAVARLGVALFRFVELVVGGAIGLISVGLFAFLDNYPVGVMTLPSPVIELAVGLGKNPPGWALAFGAVIAAGLLTAKVSLSWKKYVLLGALVTSVVGLIASNSVTAILAAIIGLGVLGSQAFRAREVRTVGFRFRFWGKVGILFLALVLMGSIFLTSFGGIDSYLARDFFSATGRRSIWTCYIGKTTLFGLDASLDFVKSCSGIDIYHLHNMLLQSHYELGLAGSLSLFAGLIWSFFGLLNKKDMFLGLVSSWRRSLALAVFCAGVVIGAAESFIFWETALYGIVFFLAIPKSQFRFGLWSGHS